MSILLALVFASGWLPLFCFRAERMTEALCYYSRSERLWVKLAPLVMTVHVSAACAWLSSMQEVGAARASAGLLVFTAGVAFWFRARVQIGPLRRTRLPDEPPLQLRRDGAFGIVRNPLYLGSLLMAAAPALVVFEAPLAASFAASFVALGVRAVQEERRLHRQLGPAYAEYCRQVKRLVPFVW